MIRWGLIAVGLLLALAGGGLAVLLVPAHLQIRDVAPVFPEPGELEAFFSSTPAGAGPIAIDYVNTATQASPSLTISHVAAVLEWADGRRLVLDAGMDAAAARDFGAPFEWLLGAEPTTTFGAVDEQMGAAAGTIRGIAFTHLHSDHTQGVTALCEAGQVPVTVFRTEAQATRHNLHTEAGHTLIEASKCEPARLAPERIAPLPGFPGIGAVPAAGHTPGSTVYLARVDGEIYVFAGDLANAMADVVADRGKGLLYSYLLVPENEPVLARWRAWLRAARQRDWHVVVAHDLSTYEAAGLTPWGGR